jgi:hypothetical protein
MPLIGIIPLSQLAAKGLSKPLTVCSLTSSRLPIDGPSAIGNIANTGCSDTPVALCIGSWMIPLWVRPSPRHVDGFGTGSGDGDLAAWTAGNPNWPNQAVNPSGGLVRS